MSTPATPVKAATAADAAAEQPLESVATQLHNKTVLHKAVANSGSKESNWVSPFRTTPQSSPSKTKNPASYITAGSTPVTAAAAAPAAAPITPPATEEEPLEATAVEDDDEEAPLEADETVAEHADAVDEDEEPLAADEEPVEEVVEEEAAEDIPSTEVPAEAPSTPATVTPVKKIRPAKQEVPAVIKAHPKMLNRYKENFNIASKIMNKNKIENFDRRVDLGAGLVLTEEQIYELARKKLEPLMKQIDDRVAENNARDAAAAAKVEETIRLNDEAVVAKDLASYKATVDSKTTTVKAEHEKRTKDLTDKAAKSKSSTETHIQKQKDGIVKDKKDSETAEDNAADAHITNKETLTATADQLKEDKTQELADSKAKQIEETESAEKFQTDAVDLQAKQVDLQSELDAKKAELEEKIKRVEALIASKHEKKETIRTSTKRRKVADRSFDIIDAKHTRAVANVAILTGQVGLLNDRLAAHSTKIDHLSTTAKEALVTKRGDATTAAADWEEHLTQVRIEEAKKQEQIRIAAEEEKKRVEQEKADEEARLAEEKAKEEERIAKEKEEEAARIAKEKEEAAIAAEKKKKEDEEEAVRVAAELERMKNLQQLNEEKIKLQKDLEQQHKDVAAAEEARAAAELKAVAASKAAIQAKAKAEEEAQKSSSAGILSGVAAAVVGVAAGAAAGAATGAAVVGSAATGVASAGVDTVGTAGEAVTTAATTTGKSAEPVAYQAELEASNAGTTLGTNNPFYAGEFTDNNDDLPSTIHEEEEEEVVAKDVTEPAELAVPAETVEEDVADNTTIGETPVETVEAAVEPVVEEPVETVKAAVEPTVETETVIEELETPIDESAIEETEAPIITEVKPVDAPVRRRSMVDEAIANMTPEKIAKMNTPLTAQLKAKAAAEGKAGTTRAEKVAAAAAAATAAATENGKRSRSGSLSSKLKLKKSSSNLKPRSRSGSFKNDAPPNLAKKAAEAENASNRTKVNASISSSTTAKPTSIAVAATTAAAATVAATTAAIVVPATPIVENSSVIDAVQTTPFSIAPSGISETAVVAEAEAVQIKPSDESPEKVATPAVENSEDEDESDLEPETANPVFTEKIGEVEETAPTTANTDPIDDNFVEVETLETVSSNEYHQNKDDPNYMIIEN